MLQLLDGSSAPLMLNMTQPQQSQSALSSAAPATITVTSIQTLAPTGVSNIISSGRPIQQAVQSSVQSVPAMQTIKSTLDETKDALTGLITGQTQVIEKALPSDFRSLNPLAKAAAKKPRVALDMPAVQQLQFCDFDNTYRDILAAVNGARAKLVAAQAGDASPPNIMAMAMAASKTSGAPTLKPLPVAASTMPQSAGAPAAPMCMNVRLMRAAKIQSDFQALVNMPTHAGPREAGLGSLEDRMSWAGFGKDASDTSSSDSDDDTAAQRQRALVVGEELVYYWPATGSGPEGTVPDMDRTVLRDRIKEAVRAWAKDAPSVRVLTDPRWRFFGAGVTRTTSGAMFLTVVLAASPVDACNLCPFDMPKTSAQPSDDWLTAQV